MTENLASFQKRLAEIQAELRQRRTDAFIDYDPVVCGLTLEPVTFQSYLKLLAFGNAFACGGAVAFKDIFQFIWVHHPEFGQNSEAARQRVLLEVHRTLNPRFPAVNAAAHVLLPLAQAVTARGWRRVFRPFVWLLRALRTPPEGERHAVAVGEIRRLMLEALHDFPSGAPDAPPLPYAQKPQLVALLMRGYGLSFQAASEIVDTLPMKQLVEYTREILHRLSGGKDKLLTPAEASVWEDYLAFKTSQVAGSGPAEFTRN